METVNQHAASVKASIITRQETATTSWFERLTEAYERGRFGWMAMIITFQSCLGSIACGYILQNTSDILLLSICAVITMLCNAILIAQAPAKLSLRISFLSVIVNTILLIVSLTMTK